MFVRTVARQFQNALVVLLQVDPRQQVAIAFFVLLFIVALNIASNAGSALLAGVPDWLLLFAPGAVFLLFVFWLAAQRRQFPAPRDPELTPDVGEYPGLVAMLGIFYARSAQDAAGVWQKEWRIAELSAALAADEPDWATILDRVEHSNLQPLLQAVRHHDHNRGLRHLWLISTADLVQLDGTPLQPGSRHLAPLVARIIRNGLNHHVTVHYTDWPLTVLPDDIGPTYRAVNYVYEQAGPRVGLRPYQVIADITGGRATMTSGMILACAPRGYPLQYTSTIVDPTTKRVSDLPQPQRLHVDTREVLRHALEAVNDRLELKE